MGYFEQRVVVRCEWQCCINKQSAAATVTSLSSGIGVVTMTCITVAEARMVINNGEKQHQYFWQEKQQNALNKLHNTT